MKIESVVKENLNDVHQVLQEVWASVIVCQSV